MINRELIRIKVVQLTYAYYQNGDKNMDSAEKELLLSLSKAYDLYNYLLEPYRCRNTGGAGTGKSCSYRCCKRGA